MEYTHPYWFRANRARAYVCDVIFGRRHRLPRDTILSRERKATKRLISRDTFHRIRFEKRKEILEHETDRDDRLFFNIVPSRANKRREFPTSLDGDFPLNLFLKKFIQLRFRYRGRFHFGKRTTPLLLFLLIFHFSKFL